MGRFPAAGLLHGAVHHPAHMVGVEGFGDIVVRPQMIGPDDAALPLVPGDADDGHGARRVQLPHLLQKVHPVVFRHEQVQQDCRHGAGLFPEQVEGLFPVGGLEDGVFFFKQPLENAPAQGIVIGDENRFLFHRSLRFSGFC